MVAISSSSDQIERQWSVQRVKAMGRVCTKLEKLERRVADGRLEVSEKIGAAATAILSRHHGHRNCDWSLKDGIFRFFEHPVHFAREQAYEGKYIIQTQDPHLSAVEARRLYKELSGDNPQTSPRSLRH